MTKQIFIGGTGRSGTSILYKLLNSHEDIFAFPKEMRFIIDYNGLINVVDALTTNYSSVQSRESLYHFEELMRKYFTDKHTAPYVGFEFDKMFGEDFYWKRLNQFVNELVVGSFSGSDYSVFGNCIYNKFSWFIRRIERYYVAYYAKVLHRKRGRSLWPQREMKNVKYFADRSELCRKVECFVDDLFMNVTKKENKSIWCEKTPLNILHLDFLYEVFPDSHFIHIKRDPRGVIQSMQNHFWADPDTAGICIAMKQIYRRWFALREQIDFNKYNYLEIKIEDLADDCENKKEEIVRYLDVDNSFINPPKVNIDKVDYWKKKMSSEDIQIVNKILGTEIEMMGYVL